MEDLVHRNDQRAHVIDYPVVDVTPLEDLTKGPKDYVGSAGWWTQLAKCLDAVREELIFCNVRDFSRRFASVAPELAELADQIPERAVVAELEIVRVRSRVRESLGNRDDVKVIQEEVKFVVHRLNLFNYLAQDLQNIIHQRLLKRTP